MSAFAPRGILYVTWTLHIFPYPDRHWDTMGGRCGSEAAYGSRTDLDAHSSFPELERCVETSLEGYFCVHALHGRNVGWGGELAKKASKPTSVQTAYITHEPPESTLSPKLVHSL